MNEKIEHLLKKKNFKVDSFTYCASLMDSNLYFDIKATLYPDGKEPINELENMIISEKLNTQTKATAAIKEQLYIVGSFDTTTCLSFAVTPATHKSEQSARAECKRLAKLFPGKLYLFVQLKGAEMLPTGTVSI